MVRRARSRSVAVRCLQRAPSDGGGGPAAHPGRRVEEGLALLDEAGVAAVSGELDPLSTGLVYCELVCALQGLAQYDVAEEWTEAMERWCKANAIGSIHGRCRVHRAEILRLRGAYDEAEREALAPARSYGHTATGAGMAAHRARPHPAPQGRPRRRRGGTPRCASRRLGSPAGLALVHLAQGRRGRGGRRHTRRARASVAGPVQGAPARHRPPAGPLLEAQVEIEIAAGDARSRRAAADELDAGGQPGSRARRWWPERPSPGAGAARRGRRGRGGAAVAPRPREAVERNRRAVRGGARPNGPRRRAPGRGQRGPGRARAAGSRRDPRTGEPRDGEPVARRERRHEAPGQRFQTRG